MKKSNKNLINFFTNKQSFFNKLILRQNKLFKRFDYSTIEDKDIFFEDFYSENKMISLPERLMYLPFDRVKEFFDNIPESIAYNKIYNHDNSFYNRIICAAVHAKNKEAINYFNKKNHIPDSILIASSCKEKYSINIHYEEEKLITPAIIAFQNHDYDMINFLNSFKSSGWSGHLSSRFNIPLFNFLHKAIEEADVKTVNFITQNNILLINSADHEGRYPLDYLSTISYENFRNKDKEYLSIFNSIVQQYKQYPNYKIKIANPEKININIMLFLYKVIDNHDLEPDFIERDIFTSENKEFHNNIKKDFYTFYNNFVFLRSLSDIYKKNKKAWRRFCINSFSSSTSAKEPEDYNFYMFSEQLQSFYKNNVLCNSFQSQDNVIENPSISMYSNDNKLPCLHNKHDGTVSLNHFNLSVLHSDPKYIKKAFVDIKDEERTNYHKDFFKLSNHIAFNKLQHCVAECLVNEDDIYNLFILDNAYEANGIKPLIYYSSNEAKIQKIDHKKLLCNYIDFIIQFLDNDNFFRRYDVRHDIDDFRVHIKDAGFIQKTIEHKMKNKFKDIDYFSLFSGMPKVRQESMHNILLRKNKESQPISYSRNRI